MGLVSKTRDMCGWVKEWVRKPYAIIVALALGIISLFTTFDKLADIAERTARLALSKDCYYLTHVAGGIQTSSDRRPCHTDKWVAIKWTDPGDTEEAPGAGNRAILLASALFKDTDHKETKKWHEPYIHSRGKNVANNKTQGYHTWELVDVSIDENVGLSDCKKREHTHRGMIFRSLPRAILPPGTPKNIVEDCNKAPWTDPAFAHCKWGYFEIFIPKPDECRKQALRCFKWVA